MHTIDETRVRATPQAAFRTGADVEQWPRHLPHYRWVRFQRKDGFGTGRVEMAAVRRFGPFPWPVWWASDMWLDEAAPAVHYRHVAGITTGMDVVWSFHDEGDGTTRVRIDHVWRDGPRWPLPRFLRRWIADAIIGPVFIHHVASRTLTGIGRAAEAQG